ASVISDDAIGSLVKDTWVNAAARMGDLRLLPVRVDSSALAADSAADLLLAINELASIWALSRALTTVGCWAMKLCVATIWGATNWPCGHGLASFASTCPPAATISAS